MTEASIVRAIQRYVKAHGGKAYKLHGGPMGHAGAPDLIGSLNGWSFAVEVKRPREEGGKAATKLQERELEEWRAQGWIAGVVRSAEEFKELLGYYDDEEWRVAGGGGESGGYAEAEAGESAHRMPRTA